MRDFGTDEGVVKGHGLPSFWPWDSVGQDSGFGIEGCVGTIANESFGFDSVPSSFAAFFSYWLIASVQSTAKACVSKGPGSFSWNRANMGFDGNRIDFFIPDDRPSIDGRRG
jgi:hypothetical protein